MTPSPQSFACGRLVRAALLLLVFLAASACDGGGGWWETDEDDMMVVAEPERIGDTWEHYCECTGTAGGVEMAPLTEPVRSCSAEQPSRFQRVVECSRLPGIKNGNYGGDGFGGAGTHVTYDCELADAVPVSLGEDNCMIGEPEDTSGVRTPLITGGAHMDDSSAWAWGNPLADREAVLDSSDNRLAVKFLKWRSARPRAQGSISLSGGLCDDGQICEIVLDGLELHIADFKLDRVWPARDVKVTEAVITNQLRWMGVKLADGSFEFPDARIQLAGKIGGEPEVAVFDSPEPVRGRIYKDRDGVEYFTIEMDVGGKRLQIQIDATFAVFAGTPTAIVEMAKRCWSGRCYPYHDASASHRFNGRSGGLRYEWHDANGRLRSRSSRLRAREDLAYPLQLRVFDYDGRFDIQKVYTPFLEIPRIPSPLPKRPAPRMPSFP